MDILLRLAAIALGLVFLVAGASKLRSTRSFAVTVASYDVMPVGAALAVARFVPVLEVIVGCVLISGRRRENARKDGLMDKLIVRVSDSLAAPQSRRGFLRVLTLGLAGGAAAVAGAGGALLAGQGPRAAFASLACCTCAQPGCSTVYCGVDYCLPTEHEANNTSTCCTQGTHYYQCTDCLSRTDGAYICSFATLLQGACQNSPAGH